MNFMKFTGSKEKPKEEEEKNPQDNPPTENQKLQPDHTETLISGDIYEIDFKGFGISFTDDTPKEIIYIRIDDISLNYECSEYDLINLQENIPNEKNTKTNINMKIGHF